MSTKLISQEKALSMLETMLLIRRFQQWIIPTYPTDVLVTPVHLNIGQEAVPAGICANLTDEDTLFFGHRTQGPALAKGLPLKKLMAELYGKTNGCSQSFGGSMHLVDPEHGMLGSSAIIGGSIALGVGSGLAAKLAGEKRIAVSYFGDAATNSGTFWESLNFAALKEIPTLFVCENNNLSNTMTQAEHLFVPIAEIASKFMHTFEADGTDALCVYEKAQLAIDSIRRERKPAFIECKTKRWMKHQGVDEDDLAYNPVDREKDCPIIKLTAFMFEHQMITQEQIDTLEEQIQDQISQAQQYALAGLEPTSDMLLQEV